MVQFDGGLSSALRISGLQKYGVPAEVDVGTRATGRQFFGFLSRRLLLRKFAHGTADRPEHHERCERQRSDLFFDRHVRIASTIIVE